MTNEQQVVLMLKDAISELPTAELASFNDARAEILEIIQRYGDPGKVAVVLIGAEMVAEE